jgi:SAM-dependent methyltransferase
MQLLHPTNIIVNQKDFTKDQLHSDLVDGILFGFSLHYQPNPTQAIRNAFNHLKPNGQIIIFEYTRGEPLPWVPFPLPKKKLIPLLAKTGFKEIDTILNNSRFYIIKSIKT